MDNIIERIELEPKNGFKLALVIMPEAGVEDPAKWDDGMTRKQIQAYNRGTWQYVCIGVIVSLDGIELGSNYLGMVEYGSFVQTDEDDNIIGTVELDGDYIAHSPDYMAQLIPEAIGDARGQLARLIVLAMDTEGL